MRGSTTAVSSTTFEPRTREKSRQVFADRIDAAYHSKPYGAFVDDVALLLRAGPFPRVVVVDNFERLDHTTRDVIARYLERFAEGAGGSEIWVVFEPRDGQSLYDLVTDEAKQRIRQFPATNDDNWQLPPNPMPGNRDDGPMRRSAPMALRT